MSSTPGLTNQTELWPLKKASQVKFKKLNNRNKASVENKPDRNNNTSLILDVRQP